MSCEQFQKLFDFLDKELGNCDNTRKLTDKFLSENNIKEKEKTLGWLKENGGHYDCEVLANVEEQFE